MKQDKEIKWTNKGVSNLKLNSLKVLVVGGTNGLGRAISQLLASLGSEVVVVGRTFRDQNVRNIKFIKGDLESIEESKKVAHQLSTESFDIALFTTGIFAASKRQETKEGLERDMAVSFLNRLAMLRIIAPKLKAEKNSFGFIPRIFIMGYPGNGEMGTIDNLNQDTDYSLMKAHMNTVAGNEAMVVVLNNEYKNFNVFGLNPGMVKTGIRNNLLGEGSWKSFFLEGIVGFFTQTPEQYASNIVPLLVAPELENHSGAMFNNKGAAIFGTPGMSKEYSAKFIAASQRLLKSKGIDV